MLLSGYTIQENLYKGKKTLVFRAVREKDACPVIVKVPRAASPEPRALAVLKKEYEISSTMNDDGVLRSLALERTGNGLALVLEDFGGVSLTRVLDRKKISLRAFLRIAIRLARALEYIHSRDVIHMDLKPHNIILNPETGRVCISDFGISTLLSRENPTIVAPGKLEGTLPYLSPEQTGRMNRVIDYRTDFYSLGATFYEMLTGRPPFQADDPMEMIHCHIAVEPASPESQNREIPVALGRIVMRLLAKNAEERYQSAAGLRADLEECLRRWKRDGDSFDFEPGRRDRSFRFGIPQKLYGRRREGELLLGSFRRAEKGESRLMLVAGYSGIGKSALVNEVHRPIAETRGFFISGKFDQLKRDVPYSSLIQAFRELVRQILTEDQEQIDAWRERLGAALGVNGQVIVDVIPEVEWITGPQPVPTELGPTETQNRFFQTFKRFLSAFARPEKPLVMFLDDLQWADSPTLLFIRMLMTDRDIRHFLLIGAYRDNEVDESHPLFHMTGELERAGVIPDRISLPPLEMEDVVQLSADTLHCDEERARPLGELVHAKTGGNPFFVSEFLQTLYYEKLLNLDPATGAWTWEIESIRAREITDNVVELMTERINRLSPAGRRILQLASGVGGRFDLQTLAIGNEAPAGRTAAELEECLREGLVVPVGDDYKFDPEKTNSQYRFLHDRVQQAAYQLIPEEERGRLHYSMGRHLLENVPADKREERLFDIVNHLNLGRQRIESLDERRELIELNLRAGRRATAASAYDPAAAYLKTGIELLPENFWSAEYSPALELHLELAKAQGLRGDYAASQQEVDRVLAAVSEVLDRSRAYEIKIRNLNAENRLPEAIDAAREILLPLGVPLPARPKFALHVGFELLKTKLLIARRGESAPLSAGAMADPKKRAAMRILLSISSSAYQTDFNMFAMTIFKKTYLTYKYGLTPGAPYALGIYAVAHAGVLKDFPASIRYDDLGLRLMESPAGREMECRSRMLSGTFTRHWSRPMAETFAPLEAGARAGLEMGDFEFGSYCHFFLVMNRLMSVADLPGLEADSRVWLGIAENHGQLQSLIFGRVMIQTVLNLQGKAPDPGRLDGEVFNPDEMMPLIRETRYNTMIGLIHTLQSWLLFLNGRDSEAADELDRAMEYEQAMVGMSTTALLAFLHGLSSVDRARSARGGERRRLLRIGRRRLRGMRKWAAACPANHARKALMLEARLEQARGRNDAAIELLDRAIREARDAGFLWEEAMACEMSGRLYQDAGREGPARTYFSEARDAYRRWGGISRAEAMDALDPEAPKTGAAEQIDFGQETIEEETRSGSGDTAALDLNSVLKASQTISSEIFLDRLLTNLMRLVLENAGARRGLLIKEKEGRLFIEAERDLDLDQTRVLQSVPVEASGLVPLPVVQYVRRTGESVVLADAAGEGRFTGAPYIQKHQSRSVLCLPVTRLGEMFGILYLENNLSRGAFTKDRIDVLNILTTQAAISLENVALVAEETERQKLQKEMEMARDVQLSILPDFPEDEAYAMSAHMTPAESVGGDYYDYYRTGQSRWLAIGDVSGHGINSGLMMMMAQTGFLTYLHSHEENPDSLDLFAAVNKTLYVNSAVRTRQNHYMTFTVLRADETGRVEHVGKHEDILVYRRATGKVEIVESTGFWMGLVPEVAAMVQKSSFRLEPGDFLTLFTDGVIECRAADGEQFDSGRLIALIESHAPAGIDAVKEAVVAACMEFMDRQEDDITLLFLLKK